MSGKQKKLTSKKTKEKTVNVGQITTPSNVSSVKKSTKSPLEPEFYLDNYTWDKETWEYMNE